MGFFIEEANLNNDTDTIIGLWKRNLSAHSSTAYSETIKKLDWYYKNNPYGYGKIWLLKTDDDNGTVVGTEGMGLRKIKVHNKYLEVGLTADLAVDTKYRTLGPALKLMKKVYEESNNGVGLIYGLPNNRAVVPTERVGFRLLGRMGRSIKILRHSKYIQKYIKWPFVSKILSFPVGFMMTMFSKETYCILPNDYVGVDISEFDAKFDVLWEEMSQNHKILSERTSKFLNWRYCECPTFDYKIYALINQTDQYLAGYIVYCQNTDNMIQIIDFSFKDGERAFDLLMSSFIKHMKKTNASSIALDFFGSSTVKTKMKKFGFIPRKEKRAIMVALKGDTELFDVLCDEESWFLTPGDEDNN